MRCRWADPQSRADVAGEMGVPVRSIRGQVVRLLGRGSLHFPRPVLLGSLNCHPPDLAMDSPR